MTKPENVPKALDAMADIVLAYRPKPKAKPAKKRKKRNAKARKEAREITLESSPASTNKPHQ
jgi:hypothetical protein